MSGGPAGRGLIRPSKADHGWACHGESGAGGAQVGQEAMRALCWL